MHNSKSLWTFNHSVIPLVPQSSLHNSRPWERQHSSRWSEISGSGPTITELLTSTQGQIGLELGEWTLPALQSAIVSLDTSSFLMANQQRWRRDQTRSGTRNY